METVNAVRAYAYLAGVFQNQQHDPFCSRCKAFVNSVNNTRDSLSRFEQELTQTGKLLSDELQKILVQSRSVITGLSLPEGAVGQKRAGNCLMPPGVCFIKSSIAILEKINPPAAV